MKISYDYHSDSIGDMDASEIPASMAAVEAAIRKAYPDAEIEVTLDKGRMGLPLVELTEDEQETMNEEDIASHVKDIGNIAWAQY